MPKLIRDIVAGDVLKGVVCACIVCGTLFIGRSDARFCSNACRMRHTRKVKTCA